MWATLGKSRQGTERAGTETQNEQVMQQQWSLEDPVPGSPTTMRLKNNLTRTPFFHVPRSVPAMLDNSLDTTGTLNNH